MHYDVYYENLYNALCIKALSVTKSLINVIWKNCTLFKITKSVIKRIFERNISFNLMKILHLYAFKK